jgi:hypothetical protein
MTACDIVFTNKNYLMNTSGSEYIDFMDIVEKPLRNKRQKGDFRNCVNRSSRSVNGSSSGFTQQHPLAYRYQHLFALVLTGLVWIVLMAKILMTPMVSEIDRVCVFTVLMLIELMVIMLNGIIDNAAQKFRVILD